MMVRSAVSTNWASARGPSTVRSGSSAKTTVPSGGAVTLRYGDTLVRVYAARET